MGYRSEVGIALKESDFNKLVAMAKESSSEDAYELLKNADKIVKIGNVSVIHFDWVKWYEDYKDIQFLENFLHTEADGYGFVRVGEDNNDLETDFVDSSNGDTFYEYVDTVREVYIPEGEEISIV